MIVLVAFIILFMFNRNALSTEMLNELQSIFKAVNEAKGARCVLLSSSGSKVFSAGHNLKELVFANNYADI
jgi:enoyl-CoA hydratase/carnithine racemase